MQGILGRFVSLQQWIVDAKDAPKVPDRDGLDSEEIDKICAFVASWAVKRDPFLAFACLLECLQRQVLDGVRWRNLSIITQSHGHE